MNKVLKLASCACVGFVFLTNAHAATIVITDQNAPPSSASTVGGGTASIVNYDGAGALKLTTANDVNDQADVVISDNFGNFGDLLTDSSLAFDYRFQKADVSGGNEFAAPALSLLLYDEGFEGDGFVTLKYEHYWNIGNAVVPTDDWIIGTIDFSGGGVWSSGGLGLENSFGGPPLFTLQNILDGTASSSALLL